MVIGFESGFFLGFWGNSTVWGDIGRTIPALVSAFR